MSTIPAFLDALKVQLDARAGLSGVRCFTAPVDPETAGKEAIILADDIDDDVLWPFAGGGQSREAYEVPGFIIVVKPGAATASESDGAIKTARDRAFAIFEEVVDQLTSDEKVSTTVQHAQVAGYKMEQFVIPEGRACRIKFTMRVRAYFTPA